MLFHLFPAITVSTNKQSRVGRPAYLARNIEPSGSTNFLSMSKSCIPGLSLYYFRIKTRKLPAKVFNFKSKLPQLFTSNKAYLTYTGHPPTALAVPWNSAA